MSSSVHKKDVCNFRFTLKTNVAQWHLMTCVRSQSCVLRFGTCRSIAGNLSLHLHSLHSFSQEWSFPATWHFSVLHLSISQSVHKHSPRLHPASWCICFHPYYKLRTGWHWTPLTADKLINSRAGPLDHTIQVAIVLWPLRTELTLILLFLLPTCTTNSGTEVRGL